MPAPLLRAHHSGCSGRLGSTSARLPLHDRRQCALRLQLRTNLLAPFRTSLLTPLRVSLLTLLHSSLLTPLRTYLLVLYPTSLLAHLLTSPCAFLLTRLPPLAPQNVNILSPPASLHGTPRSSRGSVGGYPTGDAGWEQYPMNQTGYVPYDEARAQGYYAHGARSGSNSSLTGAPLRESVSARNSPRSFPFQ